MRIEGALGVQHLLGVSGHEEYRQARAEDPHPCRDLVAHHLRHYHIGEQEVDVLLQVAGLADGVGRGNGRADLVSVAGQDPVSHLPQALFVFDEEDRLAAAGDRRHSHLPGRGGCPLGRDGQRPDRGQQRAHGGTEPGLGVDLGVSARLGDDAVDRREPQPGALALGLSAVERLEHPGQHRAVHARARVRYTQPDVAARDHSRPAGRVFLIRVHIASLNHKISAAGHGVTRIDREVHQDLLKLAGIGLNLPQAAGRIDDQGDLLAEGAAEQLLDATDDLVDVEYIQVHNVAAGEDQQLAS